LTKEIIYAVKYRDKKSVVTLVGEHEKKENFKKPHFLELMPEKN